MKWPHDPHAEYVKQYNAADPYCPVGGVETEVEAALADRLSDDDILRLLDDLRNGSEEVKQAAKTALIRGLRWIVYDSSSARAGRHYEWWGSLYDGFTVAIDRLAENRETRVEWFIREQLGRHKKEYYRLLSRNILPEPSTNSKRKKKKKATYKKLQCIETVVGESSEDEECLVNPVDLLTTSSSDVERIDLWDKYESVTRTPFEVKVLHLRHEGYTQREIATALDTTKYQVEKTYKAIDEHVQRLTLAV